MTLAESASATPTRLLTSEFWALTGVACLYFGGFGVLNALMPIFVVDNIDDSEVIAGSIMGVMALSALLSRPFYGRIADRHGARRILVIGALVSVVSMAVLIVLPPSIPAAVGSRLILGLGGAAMFTGLTMRSLELAPPKRQSQAASYILVSVHAGLGLGPILGVRIQRGFGYNEAWGTVGLLMLLSAALCMALTPNPSSVDVRPGPLVHRNALLPGLVTLFGVFAFNGFITFASLYGREVGIADVAVIFTVLSGSMVAIRLVGGRIPDLIGPIAAGSAALGITIIAALVVAFWTEPIGVYVGAVLLAAGLSLQSPSFIPLAVAGVPDNERGAAMATFTGFYDIANALVGPMLGMIVAGISYRAAFTFSAGTALVALVLLNTLVAPRWRASNEE